MGIVRSSDKAGYKLRIAICTYKYWLAGCGKGSQPVLQSYSQFKKKKFSVGSASDEYVFTYAQPAIKSFLCMLSKQCNRFLECSASNEAQHTFECPSENCPDFNAD
jgi:hypothetical protein